MKQKLTWISEIKFGKSLETIYEIEYQEIFHVNGGEKIQLNDSNKWVEAVANLVK